MRPEYAQAINGLGMALQGANEIERAFQAFDRGTTLRPDDATAWYNRGSMLARLWRLPEALVSLDRAIALKGDHSQAYARKSHVLEAMGDMQGAIAAAVQNCTLAQGDAASWSLIGDLMQKAGNLGQAIAAYNEGLKIAPQDIPCLCNKGQALRRADHIEEALQCGLAVLAVDPNHQEALVLCGNAELKLGNRDAAKIHFYNAAKKGIASSYSATPQPAKFRALMLFSPFAGNTPYEDLVKDACFDSDLAIVMHEHRYDAEVLARDADVVVNLISDADLGLDLIAPLGELVANLRKPVINHPALILGTDRESISKRLAGIKGVVMPKSTRFNAKDLLYRLRCGETHNFPLIARHAGTHGGEKMEVVSSQEALETFVEAEGDNALYLTQFVDYSSPDGLFRKYRFIFVGEEVLPYHLAIGDGWKVHHVTTRMTEVEWMREEERAFLENPDKVFGPEAMTALNLIRRIIGLDYFGIDCSLDADGNVVVFEVNATMLIHLHNQGFDYKTPHVLKIKAAFEQMLQRRATEAKALVRQPLRAFG